MKNLWLFIQDVYQYTIFRFQFYFLMPKEVRQGFEKYEQALTAVHNNLLGWTIENEKEN